METNNASTEIRDLFDRTYPNGESVIKEARRMIEIYEANKNLLENETNFIADNPSYYKVRRMISDYAIALSHYGSTKKSLVYLDKAIKLYVEDSPLVKNIDNYLYEALIFRNGVDNHCNQFAALLYLPLQKK